MFARILMWSSSLHRIICSSTYLSTPAFQLVYYCISLSPSQFVSLLACPAIDEIMHQFVSFCCINMSAHKSSSPSDTRAFPRSRRRRPRSHRPRPRRPSPPAAPRSSMAVKYMHLTARGFSPPRPQAPLILGHGVPPLVDLPPRNPLPIHRTASVVLWELQDVVVVLAQHVTHPSSMSSVQASKRSAPLIFFGTSLSPTGYTS